MPNADIFISYRRDQREQVLLIAERLQELGLSVWFDARLEAGTSFDEEINREVRTAKVVIVCWSPEAILSRWVRAEASIGLERNVLVPLFLCRTELMPPFNLVHGVDLEFWAGDPNAPAWRDVVASIRRLGVAVREPVASYPATAAPVDHARGLRTAPMSATANRAAHERDERSLRDIPWRSIGYTSSVIAIVAAVLCGEIIQRESWGATFANVALILPLFGLALALAAVSFTRRTAPRFSARVTLGAILAFLLGIAAFVAVGSAALQVMPEALGLVWGLGATAAAIVAAVTGSFFGKGSAQASSREISQ
ncbi:MAG: toll/interleukin-1 receptor domain-containing protein [Hyphomonadaceae bacterium]